MTVSARKTVFVIHTSFALVDVLNALFRQELPKVRIVNIVDDSLLADVRAVGHVPPSVVRRMVGYAVLAQSSGANAIFNVCSSVGEVADVMRQAVDIPVVKIDDAMTSDAVERGKQIAVVATLPTTLGPTARLVERKAAEAKKDVHVHRHLAEGAFDVLVGGDAQKHDEMVAAEIIKAARKRDVVVLAQASMARIVPQLGDRVSVPVLSSPLSGVKDLKRVVDQL
jgi:Asp/Glu/hydantoin racemase